MSWYRFVFDVLLVSLAAMIGSGVVYFGALYAIEGAYVMGGTSFVIGAFVFYLGLSYAHERGYLGDLGE